MAGKANPVREARTRTAERFEAIADELDRLPPQSSEALVAGLAHWSIQAGDALIDAIESNLLAVHESTRQGIRKKRDDHERVQRIPSHKRQKRDESDAAFRDWRAHTFSLYAVNYLGMKELGSFDATNSTDSQARLTAGERIRTLTKACRRLAKELDEHPAMGLLGSLLQLQNACANSSGFHDLARQREEARRVHMMLRNSFAQGASQRANERPDQGETLGKVLAELGDEAGSAPTLPHFNEPPELIQGFRDTLGRVSLCCSDCRIALRAGGADILDSAINPNEKGQPRSVELHTNLQEMESVCGSLLVGIADPRMVIDDDAERFAELGKWFGEKRDELGGVLETRGLDTPLLHRSLSDRRGVNASDLDALRSRVRNSENTVETRWADLAEAVQVIVRKPENMKSLREAVRRAGRRDLAKKLKEVSERVKSDPASDEQSPTDNLLLAAAIHDQAFGENRIDKRMGPDTELVNPWMADPELDRLPARGPRGRNRRVLLGFWYQRLVSSLAKQSRHKRTEEDIREYKESAWASFDSPGDGDGVAAPWFVRDQCLSVILNALLDDPRFSVDENPISVDKNPEGSSTIPRGKPGGYTAKELRDEAEAGDEGVSVSESTFRNIRKKTKVTGPPKGKAGQYHTYSNTDIRKLADAAEQHNFRKGGAIAASWRALTGMSTKEN